MRNQLQALEKHVLTSENSTFEKGKNILLGAVVYLIWAEIIFWIYGQTLPEFMGVDIFQSLLQRKPLSPELKFLLGCILAPICEEIIYRLHLSVVKEFHIKGLLLYAALLTSVLFGEAHSLGILSVPVQGVAGLIFCYVYIKNGYSYVSAVIMHFLINFYLYLQ